MSVLCIILARAGSKGVPGKNAAIVGGRPCLAWTIDAALSASTVRKVVLSTDGPVLAEIAKSRGIDIVERPPELATDDARVDETALHALVRTEHRSIFSAEAVVILYGNVPVRPEGVIDRAVGLLTHTGCDSVQSYQAVGKNHPLWTARLSPSGEVTPWQGEVLNAGIHRRQDLPPAYIPDGAVLCVTREALCLAIDNVPAGPHAFFGRDRRGIINPPGSVVDIDSPLDLLVADAILSHRSAPPPLVESPLT